MHGIVEDQSVQSTGGADPRSATDTDHPTWCARGPECAPDRRHRCHRSRAFVLNHGLYGDERIMVSLFAPFGPDGATGVSITGFGHDLESDAQPDYRLAIAVEDAAALSEMLSTVVRLAVPPLGELEAVARLAGARKILAEVMAAERAKPSPGVPWHSSAHQMHAVVPMTTVMRLAAKLDPGTYPVVDPYVIPDGDGPVATATSAAVEGGTG